MKRDKYSIDHLPFRSLSATRLFVGWLGGWKGLELTVARVMAKTTSVLGAVVVTSAATCCTRVRGNPIGSRFRPPLRSLLLPPGVCCGACCGVCCGACCGVCCGACCGVCCGACCGVCGGVCGSSPEAPAFTGVAACDGDKAG